jgi:hypothetical protein
MSGTFDDIARRVIVEASLSEYGISPEFVLEAWLKSRYKEILDSVSFGNVNRQVTTAFNTIAPYTTGTVTMTQDSPTVTGAGTTFTAAMVGRSFRIGTGPYYTIAGYTSATVITLDTNYVGSGGAGQNYTIVQRFYSLLTEIKWIISVLPVGQTQLIERSQEEMSVQYPDRSAAAAVPTIFSPVGWDATTGQRTIELYPPPDTLYRVLVSGYCNIPVPSLVTAPIVEIDDRLLASGALSDAQIYKASKMNDMQMIQAAMLISKWHQERYETLMNNLKRRDATWV